MATITALAGAVHTQAECELIPAWVESVFAYYIDEQIAETELVNALQYLIEIGVINVAVAGGAARHVSRSHLIHASSQSIGERLHRVTHGSPRVYVDDLNGAPYVKPNEHDNLREQAAGIQELATAMDTADAAHISAMRGAAADSAIAAAEQDAIGAAAVAAACASDSAQEVAMEIMPALQEVIMASTMGALVPSP